MTALRHRENRFTLPPPFPEIDDSKGERFRDFSFFFFDELLQGRIELNL